MARLFVQLARIAGLGSRQRQQFNDLVREFLSLTYKEGELSESERRRYHSPEIRTREQMRMAIRNARICAVLKEKTRKRSEIVGFLTGFVDSARPDGISYIAYHVREEHRKRAPVLVKKMPQVVLKAQWSQGITRAYYPNILTASQRNFREVLNPNAFNLVVEHSLEPHPKLPNVKHGLIVLKENTKVPRPPKWIRTRD